MGVTAARRRPHRRPLDLAVLAELQDGGRRYQELDEALDGDRHASTSGTDGLVVRHLDPGRVDTATLYQLTDLARALEEPLAALEQWSENNWPSVEAARRRWSRRSE